MSILSLPFLALLLTGVLLGGMVYTSFVLTPLISARLEAPIASRLVRRIVPVHQLLGAVLALAATPLAGWSLAALVLGLTGFGFLFALFWLGPTTKRNRKRGLAGDVAALAAYKGLHRAGVALNLAQMAAVLAAFTLLATG